MIVYQNVKDDLYDLIRFMLDYNEPTKYDDVEIIWMDDNTNDETALPEYNYITLKVITGFLEDGTPITISPDALSTSELTTVSGLRLFTLSCNIYYKHFTEITDKFKLIVRNVAEVDDYIKVRQYVTFKMDSAPIVGTTYDVIINDVKVEYKAIIGDTETTVLVSLMSLLLLDPYINKMNMVVDSEKIHIKSFSNFQYDSSFKMVLVNRLKDYVVKDVINEQNLTGIIDSDVFPRGNIDFAMGTNSTLYDTVKDYIEKVDVTNKETGKTKRVLDIS